MTEENQRSKMHGGTVPYHGFRYTDRESPFFGTVIYARVDADNPQDFFAIWQEIFLEAEIQSFEPEALANVVPDTPSDAQRDWASLGSKAAAVPSLPAQGNAQPAGRRGDENEMRSKEIVAIAAEESEYKDKSKGTYWRFKIYVLDKEGELKNQRYTSSTSPMGRTLRDAIPDAFWNEASKGRPVYLPDGIRVTGHYILKPFSDGSGRTYTDWQSAEVIS